MKNTKTKSWLKKIVIGLLLGVVIMVNLGALTATAEDDPGAENSDGTCVTATYIPVLDGPGCADPNTINKCTDGKHGYILESNAKMCDAADAASGASQPSSVGRQTMEAFSTVILAIEGAINRLMFPLLHMIGDLLGNQLLFGSGMEERLKEIWVPVRNIINILFVVALVALALYNVLGIGGDDNNYSIKSLLPKLVVAIIAVNFSFIGIKVFLDAVNVMSTAVFAIPGTIQTERVLDKDTFEGREKIQAYCKKMYAEQSSDAKLTGADRVKNGIETMAAKYVMKEHSGYTVNTVKDYNLLIGHLNKTGKTELATSMGKSFAEARDNMAQCAIVDGVVKLSTNGEKFFNEFRTNNAALAMAVNMGNILFYEQPDNLTQLAANQYESFTINIIFSLLLFIVYTVSFLALFIILIARLIILWIALAFSPIIAVALIIPQVKEKANELITPFVANAIAPIKIAAAMSVGWIMMQAMQNIAGGESKAISGIQNSLIAGVPLPGLDTIMGLLTCLATVAVVWIGVFSAAKGTLAESLLESIKKPLESAGSWLATAPVKFLPWIPVEVQDKAHGKHGEQLSLGSLGKVWEKVRSNIDEQPLAKAKAAFPGLWPESGNTAADIADGQSLGLTKALLNDWKLDKKANENAIRNFKARTQDSQNLQTAISNGDFKTVKSEETAKNLLNGYYEKRDLGPTEKNDLKKMFEEWNAKLDTSAAGSAARTAAEIKDELKDSFTELADDKMKKVAEMTVGLNVGDNIATARTTVAKLLKIATDSNATPAQVDAVIKAKLTSDKGLTTDKTDIAKIDAKITELDKSASGAAPAAPAAPAPAPTPPPTTPPAAGGAR